MQSYVWQELDLAPKFPELKRFLDFWTREIDGRLHSIRIAGCDLIQPGRLAHANHLMTLH